ncbi:hypothetical protein OLX02_11230 [Novosphingobium sp. KCTC 2891]|uniref:hypothetical protein n=1 Tax=Novosphingobium sp. KCTC 2891 TaxID=2989730 RepID=UPI002222F239|nr:hypothetical protein [Novosphingobium sp. KCTC 2891]MCW1383393.1 hypothetical protein [Novosphingobium sp. KCTC 2891]
MTTTLNFVPAAVAGSLAAASLRTSAGWVRFAQWDAVMTHLAIGAMLGATSLVFVRRARPA